MMIRTLALSLLLSLASASIAAPAPHAGKGLKHKPGGDEAGQRAPALSFSAAETQRLQDFYLQRPSLIEASRKDLPPGIRKKLARGGTLPPGLQNRVIQDSVRHTLPPLPNGYERVIVDGRVLLIELATRAILDALILE